MKRIMKKTTQEERMVFEKKMDEIFKELCDEKEGDQYVSKVYVDMHYSGMNDLTTKDLINMGDDYLFEIYDGVFDEHEALSEIQEQTMIRVKKDELLSSLLIESELYEFLQDVFRFNLPSDLFDRFTVRLNIMLDFGDANYDYTLNSLDTIESEESFYESSLLEFIELSGYSKKRFLKFIEDDEGESSDIDELNFFNRIYSELHNNTTGMNALTLFINVPFVDYYKVEEADYIIFQEGTKAGLYDPWNGAGSLLEITLPKDISIAKKNMRIELEEDMNGYSVESIYGRLDIWDNEAIFLKEFITVA